MCFTEIQKEKGTLQLPIEEIAINRVPPPYIPETITSLPFDTPSRPALVFELKDVLCTTWVAGMQAVPNLDVKYFQEVIKSGSRLTKPLLTIFALCIIFA